MALHASYGSEQQHTAKPATAGKRKPQTVETANACPDNISPGLRRKFFNEAREIRQDNKIRRREGRPVREASKVLAERHGYPYTQEFFDDLFVGYGEQHERRCDTYEVGMRNAAAIANEAALSVWED